MHKSITLLPLLVVATCAIVALQGCAPGVAKTEPARRIAVLSIPEPVKFSIVIDKHPDATASLDRALFFSADLALGERRLREATDANPAAGPAVLGRLTATLSESLLESLRGAGVVATIAPEPHHDRIELVSNYAELAPQATTVVDVIPRSFGYWAEYPARIYRPWVRLEYRVYDVREKKIVKTGFIGTGPAPGDGAWIPVGEDDAFTFATFEALLADPVRAAAGLSATIPRVASALARAL